MSVTVGQARVDPIEVVCGTVYTATDVCVFGMPADADASQRFYSQARRGIPPHPRHVVVREQCDGETVVIPSDVVHNPLHVGRSWVNVLACDNPARVTGTRRRMATRVSAKNRLLFTLHSRAPGYLWRGKPRATCSSWSGEGASPWA